MNDHVALGVIEGEVKDSDTARAHRFDGAIDIRFFFELSNGAANDVFARLDLTAKGIKLPDTETSVLLSQQYSVVCNISDYD